MGFKIASLFLRFLGHTMDLGVLVPRIGNSILLLLFYTVSGVGIPMIAICAVRKLCELVNKVYTVEL